MKGTLTVAQRVVLALLRGYQLFFSPMFAGSCRFVPSCSAYAVEAVTRFGVVRGSLLALGRLSRCRPLAAHGFDPVPSPHECPSGTSKGRLRRRTLAH
jgi:putative membrane protein insertion efficiency factor